MIPRCPVRTDRTPTTSVIAKADSIRSSAASRAKAVLSKSCSTGDALAAGKPFFQLGGMDHSPNHRLLAWSVDDKGSEMDTLRVRDLTTGKDLPDLVAEVSGSPVWTTHSSAFYYVRLDDNHRPSRIYRHLLGTPASDDTLIYEEQDSRFFVSLGRTQSGRFADISVHDHETSESWLLDLTDTDATPRLVAARHASVQYDVEHHPNWNG